jgi:hypothetical protein
VFKAIQLILGRAAFGPPWPGAVPVSSKKGMAGLSGQAASSSVWAVSRARARNSATMRWSWCRYRKPRRAVPPARASRYTASSPISVFGNRVVAAEVERRYAVFGGVQGTGVVEEVAQHGVGCAGLVSGTQAVQIGFRGHVRAEPETDSELTSAVGEEGSDPMVAVASTAPRPRPHPGHGR